MKYWIKTLLTAVAVGFLVLMWLSGCSWGYLDPPMVPTNPVELCEWVAEEIEYKTDAPQYVQSPRETLDRGTGDCEDFAILYMWLLGREDAELVIVLVSDTAGHAVVELEGEWYDPSIGWVFEIGRWRELDRMSYRDVMRQATEMWTKTFDETGEV